MCLAIVKPANIQIKKKHLRAGFAANSDGAGLAWVQAGKLHISKGHFTWPAFEAALAQVPPSSPALLHFRIRTHGPLNDANCHPFPLLNGRAAMIHNGILDYPSSPELSDTAHFAAEILDPLLAHNPADAPHVRHCIEKTIGPGNKIAVLFNDGRSIIYNEKQGAHHKGAWFSNTSWRESRPWYVTGPAGWDDDLDSNWRYPIAASYATAAQVQAAQPQPATPAPSRALGTLPAPGQRPGAPVARCPDCRRHFTWHEVDQVEILGYCPNCYTSAELITLIDTGALTPRGPA